MSNRSFRRPAIAPSLFLLCSIRGRGHRSTAVWLWTAGMTRRLAPRPCQAVHNGGFPTHEATHGRRSDDETAASRAGGDQSDSRCAEAKGTRSTTRAANDHAHEAGIRPHGELGSLRRGRSLLAQLLLNQVVGHGGAGNHPRSCTTSPPSAPALGPAVRRPLRRSEGGGETSPSRRLPQKPGRSRRIGDRYASRSAIIRAQTTATDFDVMRAWAT